MGLLNLRHFQDEIEKREKVVDLYRELLDAIDGVTLFLEEKEGKKANYAYFPIVVDEKKYGISRDELYTKLKNHNIYSRKYFYPITADQACFKNEYKNAGLENARMLSNNILVLPLYADLEPANIRRIADVIRKDTI